MARLLSSAIPPKNVVCALCVIPRGIMATYTQGDDAVTSGAGTPGFQALGVGASQPGNTGSGAQGSVGNLPSDRRDPERHQTPPSSTPESLIRPSPGIDLSMGVYSCLPVAPNGRKCILYGYSVALRQILLFDCVEPGRHQWEIMIRN